MEWTRGGRTVCDEAETVGGVGSAVVREEVGWIAVKPPGRPARRTCPGRRGYRLYSMTVQAALEGMGVALGHSLLIAPYLKRGTLVALFEPPVAAPARYFLAIAPGSGDKPEARAFLDWIRAESRKSDAAEEPAVLEARDEG